MATECKYPNLNGYQGYKHGCRCETCRIGEAIRVRERMRWHDQVNCKLKCADKRARKYGVMCFGFPRQLLRLIYRNCPPGWTVDHIVPMCKGGMHHPMNVQYMTLEENLKKGRQECWSAAPGTTIQWQDVIGGV